MVQMVLLLDVNTEMRLKFVFKCLHNNCKNPQTFCILLKTLFFVNVRSYGMDIFSSLNRVKEISSGTPIQSWSLASILWMFV